MICCIVGMSLVALLLAGRRFVRVRVLRRSETKDPAAWRLHPR